MVTKNAQIFVKSYLKTYGDLSPGGASLFENFFRRRSIVILKNSKCSQQITDTFSPRVQWKTTTNSWYNIIIKAITSLPSSVQNRFFIEIIIIHRCFRSISKLNNSRSYIIILSFTLHVFFQLQLNIIFFTED